MVMQAVLGLCRGQWRPVKGFNEEQCTQVCAGKDTRLPCGEGGSQKLSSRPCPPDPPRPAPPNVADALTTLPAGGLLTELLVTAMYAAPASRCAVSGGTGRLLPILAALHVMAAFSCWETAQPCLLPGISRLALGLPFSPPCIVLEQVSEGEIQAQHRRALVSKPLPAAPHMSDTQSVHQLPRPSSFY